MKENIRINIDGDSLVGTLFSPKSEGYFPAIIYLNGRGGLKERFYPIAKHFLKKGYASLCFDFRGRGESVTKKMPPMKYQLEDAKEVIKYIKSHKNIDTKKLILVATSMGGYVAASISAINNNFVQKVILFEPSLFLKKAESKPYEKITAEDVVEGLGHNPMTIRSIVEISKYKGELYLIIHEKSSYYEEMKIINEIYFSNATKARKKRKIEIPGVGHAIFKSKQDVNKAIDFLDTIVK